MKQQSLIFIERPVMTALVMLAILLAGVMGYRLLPVNDLPNVDFPTISVSASLPGASPDTMASAVATPLEKEFTTINGVSSMTSTSSKGNTQITLQFDLSRNIDAAAQDVQASISEVIGRLPSDMPDPPTFRKVNPADSPILYMAVTSDNLPLSMVNEYANTFIAQSISTIAGVAQVEVQGEQKFAVRAQIDPRELSSRGIGIDEVTAAVRAANVNMPTGDLDGSHRSYSIESNGQLLDSNAYRSIVVAYRNGAPVRLDQVGHVIDSVSNNKSAGWYNSTRSIILTVQRQPGTNTVEVVDRILNRLPTFRAQMPPAIDINVLFDRSLSIRHSVADVKFTLLLTIVLVILVIFAFLRNVSATIIPSLALPMSVIGTFAVMYLLGYSIDNLSLMALTLSVGFVVDDAIVVLENIVRHMEMGEEPHEAAIKGTKEIAFTVISMTLSLAAVFLPILFMGGILGRLLQEFAATITTAILISGFISLSLTPMLCSRYLRHQHQRHGLVYNLFERFFDGLLHIYDTTLKLALKHRLAMVAVFVLVILATGWMFKQVPMGFLPSEDTGRVMVQTEAAQGISFNDMVRHQKAVGDVLVKDPAIQALSNSVRDGNTGRAFMALKPRNERDVSADEFIQRIRPKLAQIPGIKSYAQNPPSIRIGGRLTKSLYQFTLQSPDVKELYHYAPMLEAKLSQDGIFQDVTTDMQLNNPQVSVKIDRVRAATLGISAMQIEDALYSAYGSRSVSTIYAANDTYDVILEVAPEFQDKPEVLDALYVHAADGKLIPLRTLVNITNTVGPLSINHQGQLPAVTVSFNLAPGISIGEGVSKVNAVAAQVLPRSISTSFQGTAQAFQDSLQGLGLLLLMAILVIYIVLGILYESFIHPITILTGLPSAGFGALAVLLIFKMELNLYSFVGIIMLVGIVKKNAIMMIDFALEEQKKGNVTPGEAIYRGCLVRFRPIMMTSAAALMGAVPIAIGMGEGADARRPLGLAIVGGLLFSQFLTLYITPVFYTYFEGWREAMRRRKDARLAQRAKAAPAIPAPEAQA